MSGEGARKRTTSFALSDALISALDKLKPVYGVRSRGAVVEQLLEYLLQEGEEEPSAPETLHLEQPIQEASSLVLFVFELLRQLCRPDGLAEVHFRWQPRNLVLIRRQDQNDADPAEQGLGPRPGAETGGIDLPGFVSKRSRQLKQTLTASATNTERSESDPVVAAVCHGDLQDALKAADDHWISLYGQPPGGTVVEAAITWLSRDLWNSVDASEGRPFTWTGANAAVHELCREWTTEAPTLGRVMVVAGTLEDPFATANLAERMPTMIRRFVNRFRRSQKVTSFETLESTMTVLGALKLLGLSTQPGAEVTLSSIKEAYRTSARNAHPDTGGSPESMRRVSEAYQLLSGVYRR